VHVPDFAARHCGKRENSARFISRFLAAAKKGAKRSPPTIRLPLGLDGDVHATFSTAWRFLDRSGTGARCYAV